MSNGGYKVYCNCIDYAFLIDGTSCCCRICKVEIEADWDFEARKIREAILQARRSNVKLPSA